MSRKMAREDAFKLLFSIEVGKNSPEDALFAYENRTEPPEDAFSLKDPCEDDALFFQKIVHGVMDNKERVDSMISGHTKWDIRRISKVSLILLRIAVYEMLAMKEVPISVSISEAVRLAKLYGTEKDAPFINASLAAISKETEAHDAD